MLILGNMEMTLKYKERNKHDLKFYYTEYPLLAVKYI